jgi:ribonuclease-3
MIKIPNFKNKNLLKQALTHRSFLNETKEKVESNERLEFLGDSIISFVVSDYLYVNYGEFDEGKLTNLRSLLVNTRSLAQLGEGLELGKELRLSKGEEESGGRNNLSLLADAFEAVVGALYLDQGIEVTTQFLREILIPQAEVYIQKKVLKDPKSLLQEHVQSQKLEPLTYKVIEEKGPAHAKVFTMGVFVGQKQLGTGVGKSKQEAEENAAESALDRITKI